MKNMQNWIHTLFKHKPGQANTLLAPETQPEAASPLPGGACTSFCPLFQLTTSDRTWKVARSVEDSVAVVWEVGATILNEFDVTDLLGKGGTGIVHKIYYRPWGKELAVKSPRPEIFATQGGKENFMREAETWMNLREHPHLLRCYFVRTLDDMPRVFAEYVDGGSLRDWIRQRNLYAGGSEWVLERILDLAIQVAWGLHAVHEQGLIHQDVKPANVMLTAQGIAKVIDFGLAKALTEERELQDGQVHLLASALGMTPAYCSPEQAMGQKLSRKTDIWSWGLLVLEMFTGKVTWGIGVVAPEVLARYKGQDPTIPVMPAEVRNLLNTCFYLQPEARPETMLEVARDVQVIYADVVGRPYSRERVLTVAEERL